MTFQTLGLCAPILTALEEHGYERPSPIQEKAIPPALAGRDVLGCAQTGTGKTCAFAAPILQRLSASRVQGHPLRALILTPTRGVDILVATPGRLMDLYQQGFVKLDQLEIFVLDEADRMLDMGFIHDVKKILKWLPRKKQTMLFSATMPPEIAELVNSLLHDPVRVAVDPVSSPVEAIQQSVYFVDKNNKTKLLAYLIRELDVKNALVFTRTKHGANKVARDLAKAGITAAAIHGNKSQTARQQALADFKAGKIQCLVATDIAARGLDIEELSHVFNYNLPEVPETYVHRIGRTGRAGREGVAVAFCDFGEKPLLRDIEKLMGRTVPVVEDHPYPMVVLEAPKKDKRGRIINEEDAEARAAAKERRRAQDAANKAAAEERKKKADAAAEARVKLTMDVGALDNRIRLLTEMEKDYEGFNKAVKLVCQAQNNLRGIHGPVAGLMKTDGKYSLAIEIALGAGLQNIVVDREEDAKSAIAFLKQREGGRATFLPLTAIRGEELREHRDAGRTGHQPGRLHDRRLYQPQHRCAEPRGGTGTAEWPGIGDAPEAGGGQGGRGSLPPGAGRGSVRADHR